MLGKLIENHWAYFFPFMLQRVKHLRRIVRRRWSREHELILQCTQQSVLHASLAFAWPQSFLRSISAFEISGTSKWAVRTLTTLSSWAACWPTPRSSSLAWTQALCLSSTSPISVRWVCETRQLTAGLSLSPAISHGTLTCLTWIRCPMHLYRSIRY